MRLFFLFVLAVPTTALADPINAVIGDESWIGSAGSADDAGEVVRIRTHLAYVETILRDADVSHLRNDQRARRSTALDALAAYRRGGVFPRRTTDAFSGRRPRFIDESGVHCAVGQLIAAAGFADLAARIRDAHEYAYVPDIDDPELLEWATTHGFSVRDLAMIQPAYEPPPSAESTRRRIEEMKDAITLQCAREHEPPPSFLLKVRGDSHGEVHPRARSNDPFVRCFLSKLGHLGAGGAWDVQPSRFRLRMRVRITPPQELLERRMQGLRLDGGSTSCIPRPGPAPERAFFNVRIDQRGTRVGARTEPRNDEVERCLRDWMRQFLAAFGPGPWELHARAPNLALGRVMSTERLQQALESYAPAVATECSDHGAPTRGSAHVRASVGEPFTISVEGGEVAWRECLSERLDERLRSNFAVSRLLSNGSYERFFLVDAPAEAEHAFDVETPDARDRRAEEERLRREREMENYSL